MSKLPDEGAFAPDPAALNRPPEYSSQPPAPVPPFARFEVVILNDDSTPYRAHGQTLDDVIADQRDRYRASWVYATNDLGMAGGRFATSEPDRVVWEDLRVVGVLRPRADGSLDWTPFPAPAPSPDVPLDDPRGLDDLACLARDITGRAIIRWAEARREAREAYQLSDDPTWSTEHEKWSNVAGSVGSNSTVALIHSILAFDPGYSGLRSIRAEGFFWEPRAVRCAGKLYIAFASDEDDARKHGGDQRSEDRVMALLVLDESRIVDIERGGYLAGRKPS